MAIGYIIDPARHRQGIVTEAVSLMLDFCFGELGLHRAQAFIHPDNTAARKLVEKLGFRYERLAARLRNRSSQPNLILYWVVRRSVRAQT